MSGSFTPEMEHTYLSQLEKCASNNLIDYSPDVVLVHDPQPLGLTHYLKKTKSTGATWIWRCHIDIEEAALIANPGLLDLISDWIEHYDAAIFSAAHYIVSRWPSIRPLCPVRSGRG